MMDAPIPSTTRHLVVICPTWVGDCVMATPVLRAARAALPEAKITAVGQPALKALLTPLPWIDEFIGVDAKSLTGTARAGRAIAALDADAVLVLPNSFRSALVAWIARVPVRVGVASDARGRLLTHIIEMPEPQGIRTTHEHYILLVARAMGLREADVDRTMELAVSDEQQAVADQLLEDVDKPFVLLNPGAMRENKRWPAERFALVADRLAQDADMQAVVTGSPGEREVVAAVVRAARLPVIDLVDRGVSLGSLKGVIKRAAIMITNDTGPRHMAIALRTPTVSMFGPTDARHTLIPGANERILRAEPFLPEEVIADDVARECAIERISVGDVLAACAALRAAPKPQAV